MEVLRRKLWTFSRIFILSAFEWLLLICLNMYGTCFIALNYSCLPQWCLASLIISTFIKRTTLLMIDYRNCSTILHIPCIIIFCLIWMECILGRCQGIKNEVLPTSCSSTSRNRTVESGKNFWITRTQYKQRRFFLQNLDSLDIFYRRVYKAVLAAMPY